MPVNTRSKERQFHKILWQEQNSFPDNYTGEHFLEALIVRADAPRSGYWRVVLASLPVIQQLCAEVILACSAYNLWKVRLRYKHNNTILETTAKSLKHKTKPIRKFDDAQGTLHPLELLFWDTIALFTGAFILRYCNKKRGKALSKSWKQRLTAMIETGGVVMLTAVLAPVFATLTASISSDTILACASFLSIGQMYLRDYSGSEGFNRSITSCLSLACGMAASVLLSSQLEDTDAVFALVRPYDFCVLNVFSPLLTKKFLSLC